MKSRYSEILLFAVLAVFAACMSHPTYAAPPTDACSLLTQAQVSAVLGVNVGPGQNLTPKMCHWSEPGQTGPKRKGAMLVLQDAQAFAYAKMPVGNGITKVPVSGIGDDAVYGTTPGFPTVLTVKKGNLTFVVHVSGFPDDQIKAKEKTLALDVLAKL
jgi:hypothetical protein